MSFLRLVGLWNIGVDFRKNFIAKMHESDLLGAAGYYCLLLFDETELLIF